MDTKNAYGLIKIGLRTRQLADVEGLTAKKAFESIIDLESLLGEAGFDVSVKGMNLFGEPEKELSSLAEDDLVTREIAEHIASTAISVERIIFAEAHTKKIYLLPNRRFNTEYLLLTPQQFLKAGHFERLSDLAKSDIASACRCLLFGEATAAAFHILRGTEDILKNYYFFHRRKARLDKPMWAAMVTQLRMKKTRKPPSVLLDSLDLVRISYRNPTQHPQAIYDIESAQDLFGLCLDLINKMVAELPETVARSAAAKAA